MVLFKYSLLGQQVWTFFFTFPENRVGRTMGNETIYWDGLNDKKMLYLTYLGFSRITQKADQDNEGENQLHDILTQ